MVTLFELRNGIGTISVMRTLILSTLVDSTWLTNSVLFSSKLFLKISAYYLRSFRIISVISSNQINKLNNQKQSPCIGTCTHYSLPPAYSFSLSCLRKQQYWIESPSDKTFHLLDRQTGRIQYEWRRKGDSSAAAWQRSDGRWSGCLWNGITWCAICQFIQWPATKTEPELARSRRRQNRIHR